MQSRAVFLDSWKNKSVVILGGDGFIGRHLAFEFRKLGAQVTCVARSPQRLRQMGFRVIPADLQDPKWHSVSEWRVLLGRADLLINSAGILDGSDREFHAVHVAAPQAIYAALPSETPRVLISAVGIDHSETRFAEYRRQGETIAINSNVKIIRAGLVLGNGSYGGSSLFRAVAAFPFVLPIIGDGTQEVNPIHAQDLAKVILYYVENGETGQFEVGGPETLTMRELLIKYRSWLGLETRRTLHLPTKLVSIIGAIGSVMKLGPISKTATAQLSSGIKANVDHKIADIKGVSAFAFNYPGQTQDLWHARLYLLRPVLRVGLIILWIFSGVLGLCLPPESFSHIIPETAMSMTIQIALARAGGVLDLIIAYLLLIGWQPRRLTVIQVAVILSYSALFIALAPLTMLEPLGGILKNLPILLLLLVVYVLEEER